MLKKYVSLFILTVGFSCLSASAEPIIINDLGGLYLNKNLTEMEMRNTNQVESDYIIKESSKANVNKESDINIVPTTSESEYTFAKGKMDVSQRSHNEIDFRGVNNSKTMYTDDLGRLHFFGKGNIIRE